MVVGGSYLPVPLGCKNHEFPKEDPDMDPKILQPLLWEPENVPLLFGKPKLIGALGS